MLHVKKKGLSKSADLTLKVFEFSAERKLTFDLHRVTERYSRKHTYVLFINRFIRFS